MPVARMRMRPWLEKMIDSNRVPGLQWVDKAKTMFSIPWKHAARHGWELEKDASLFKLWAIHTGKYVEGQTCDPKTWKANFRCAMNSLPDIEEVKDKSINKGHQAMRVFKLLPVSPKSRDKRSRMGKLKKNNKVKYEDESSDSECMPSPVSLPQHSPQDNRVDSTMYTEQQDVRYPSPVQVPDFSAMVEIGSESYNHRFQVSPSHSSCDDPYTDKMIEICAELESEQWMSSSLDNRGFLSNEACTSPGSQWSEGSSADELDELPRPEYTLLSQNYTMTPVPTDDIWSNFCPNHLLML